LSRQYKKDLISFLCARYDGRYFKPIRLLGEVRDSHQGYGMAMMSLCSLLIESIQCLRDGLPTTSDSEWKQYGKLSPPTCYQIARTERKNGRKAFRDFFDHFQSLFPDVNGAEFYGDIRCGLLHQAQTKNGWRIRINRARLCHSNDKVINRNLFADALEAAFKRYLDELRAAPADSEIWKKARRRIWWLICLSE